jgi:hypothetical protein
VAGAKVANRARWGEPIQAECSAGVNEKPQPVIFGECLAGANKREVNSGEFTVARYARETLNGGQLANVQ